MEIAETEELFEYPLHPYTKSLISAIPIPDPTNKSRRIVLTGDVPSPINPPSGCHFHPRCMRRMDVCSREVPPLREKGDGHFYRCFLE